MTPDALLTLSRTLATVALIVMAVQLVWFALRGRVRARQMVRARLQHAAEVSTGEPREPGLSGGHYERLAMKAGISYDPVRLTLVVFIVVIATFAVLIFYGPLMGALVLGGFLALGVIIWNLLYQRQRRSIFDTLPDVMDDVIRNVDAGRSLEMALLAGLEQAPEVYAPLTFRLRSAVEAGRDYTHLMDDFAELYQVPPLVFVAVALRTSSRFGSSIRPILKQVSAALRAQQEMRREFMAATAETRFTAAAFAILPPGIGVGMIAMNDSFREVLLETDAGHKMLMIAGGLIVVAILIIMHMVRGVGRG